MRRRLLLVTLIAALLALPGAQNASAARAVPGRALELSRVVRIFRAAPSSHSPKAKCPSAPACDVFKLGRTRWAVSPEGTVTIGYLYSDAGRPSRAPDAATVRAAVARAAAAWESRDSNVSFAYRGTTQARPGDVAPGSSCGDGINAVGWAPLGRALAQSAVCYDRRTGRIYEADLTFNSSLAWQVFAAPDPASRAYDVQSIATHELGHFLSLLDLYSPRARGQTMFGSAEPGEISKRTLALGDVLGIQAAYPCSESDRCPSGAISED